MEATKERAARRDRATPARTSGSSPAHGSRTQSITRRRRRAKARIRQTAVLLTAAVMVAGIGVAVSTIGTDRPTAADLPTPTAEQPAVVIQTPAASTQTPEPTEAPARYPLSVSERDTVERVVMAEAGGESFAGQMLVAQCICAGLPRSADRQRCHDHHLHGLHRLPRELCGQVGHREDQPQPARPRR